ncbi:MAG: hypothetical protein R3B54_01445 [Bdellovibrionota bacterium]
MRGTIFFHRHLLFLFAIAVALTFVTPALGGKGGASGKGGTTPTTSSAADDKGKQDNPGGPDAATEPGEAPATGSPEMNKPAKAPTTTLKSFKDGSQFKDLAGGDGKSGAIPDMNDQAARLSDGRFDPFNPREREAYTQRIIQARKAEAAAAKAILNSDMSANDAKALAKIVADRVQTRIERRNQSNVETAPEVAPERIQQALQRVQEARQFTGAEPPPALDPIRNLDEYKLFTDSGDEIPVLVDNTEVGFAEGSRANGTWS